MWRGRASGNKSLQLRQGMLPEIQDNCPGKILGMDSEAVVANALSRCLAHPAERRTPQECVYSMIWLTVQLSLRAECFVLWSFMASSGLCFVFFHLSLLTGSQSGVKLMGGSKGKEWCNAAAARKHLLCELWNGYSVVISRWIRREGLLCGANPLYINWKQEETFSPRALSENGFNFSFTSHYQHDLIHF